MKVQQKKTIDKFMRKSENSEFFVGTSSLFKEMLKDQHGKSEEGEKYKSFLDNIYYASDASCKIIFSCIF